MKNAVDAVVTPEAAEVVETVVKQNNLFTPKRLAVAAAVTVGVVGTVLIVRKFRKVAEDHQEAVDAAAG